MYKLWEIGVWETRLLPLEPSESLRDPLALALWPSKVIPLEGSLLGWVDLPLRNGTAVGVVYKNCHFSSLFTAGKLGLSLQNASWLLESV